MQVKFWSPEKTYKKQKKHINKAIRDVLESGSLVLGSGGFVEKFEEDFAYFMGMTYGIMCGGGTHALYLAYRAHGIGPGDEVITTSHTFVATIDQIVALGATPILVDIGEDGLIDPEEIKKAITPKTKAMVPVHLEGKVCNIQAIDEIARQHNLIVIEDAAQAIGADLSSNNTKCFSMYPAKILGSIGNAGMVLTNDAQLAEKLRMLRCNSNIGKNRDLSVGYGMQLEPDNIHASVLSYKLGVLGSALHRREKIAEMYNQELKYLPIRLPLEQCGRVYQDYVIRVGQQKDEFVQHLARSGVGFIGHNLIPSHHYPNLQLNFNLPQTDQYISEQIRIPCNPDLTDREVKYVIKTIRNFYK